MKPPPLSAPRRRRLATGTGKLAPLRSRLVGARTLTEDRT